jgi:TRAP-type uncharacterized transport system substrate-binding protein
MRNKWIRITAVVILILLPWVIIKVYDKITDIPKEITVATGSPGGLYRPLSENLARMIEKKLKVKIHTVRTFPFHLNDCNLC